MKPKRKRSRAAESMAAIRAYRRDNGLCLFCGDPAEIKKMADGTTRRLRLCPPHNEENRK